MDTATTPTIRYNQLPPRFLRNQDPGFRTWARSCAAAGTLYYSPAAGGLRTIGKVDPVPEGWARVDVVDSPVARARFAR